MRVNCVWTSLRQDAVLLCCCAAVLLERGGQSDSESDSDSDSDSDMVEWGGREWGMRRPLLDQKCVLGKEGLKKHGYMESALAQLGPQAVPSEKDEGCITTHGAAGAGLGTIAGCSTEDGYHTQKIDIERARRAFNKAIGQSTKKSVDEKMLQLGILRFLPYALLKVIENCPQPWEHSRAVSTLFHADGIFTIIASTSKHCPCDFKRMWQRALRLFAADDDARQIPYPIFGNDEKMVLYETNVALPAESRAYDELLSEGAHNRPASTQAYWAARMKLRVSLVYNAKLLNLKLDSLPSWDTEGRKEAAQCGTRPAVVDYRLEAWRLPLEAEDKVSCPFIYYSDSTLLQSFVPRSSGAAVQSSDVSISFFDMHPAVFARSDEDYGACFCSAEYFPAQDTYETAEFADAFMSPVEHSSAAVWEGGNSWEGPVTWRLEYDSHTFRRVYTASERSKRTVDIDLVGPVVTDHFASDARAEAGYTTMAHRRLMKHKLANAFATERIGKRSVSRNMSIVSLLRHSIHFARCDGMDWLEASMQLVQQAHRCLSLVVHKKGLTFYHLDYNFNLLPIKLLTTKERKKSRFGNSFHLIRELCKLVKYIVDLHIAQRMYIISPAELCLAMHDLFLNIGRYTGIYRYKYKVNDQIRILKDTNIALRSSQLSFLDGTLSCKDVCLWHCLSRVVVFYLRGVAPLLERYLTKLLSRATSSSDAPNTKIRLITRQRVLTNQVLELQNSAMASILSLVPNTTRNSRIVQNIVGHMLEAWRSWKAGITYDSIYEHMPKQIEAIIRNYVDQRADYYMLEVTATEKSLLSMGHVQKIDFRRYIGKVSRLQIRREKTLSAQYLLGDLFTPAYIRSCKAIVSIFAAILRTHKTVLPTHYSYVEPRVTSCCSVSKHLLDILQRVHPKIAFPLPGYSQDQKLLAGAMEDLKAEVESGGRMDTYDKELLVHISRAFDSPNEYLTKIKKALLTQRSFACVTVQYCLYQAKPSPSYRVASMDRIVDAYVSAYLAYNIDTNPLLRSIVYPNWVLPQDSCVPHVALYRVITSLDRNMSSLAGSSTAPHLVVTTFTIDSSFRRTFDSKVLAMLLKSFVDNNIVDYIMARNASTISYKDMQVTNACGYLPAFEFSWFLDCLVLSLLDAVLILGKASCLDDNDSEFDAASFAQEYLDLLHTTGNIVNVDGVNDVECMPFYGIIDATSEHFSSDPQTGGISSTQSKPRLQWRASSGITLLFYVRSTTSVLMINSVARSPLRRSGDGDVPFQSNAPCIHSSSAPNMTRCGTPLDDQCHLKTIEGVTTSYDRDELCAIAAVTRLLESCIPILYYPPLHPTGGDVHNVVAYWNVRSSAIHCVKYSGIEEHPLVFEFLGFDAQCYFVQESDNTRKQSLQRLSEDNIVWAIGCCRTVLTVSISSQRDFRFKMQQLLYGSTAASFATVASKWNSLFLNFVVYYREAIGNTPRFLLTLVRYENKLKNKIKIALNSRMSDRFPSVLFYSPKEVGGLGMLSIGSTIIKLGSYYYAPADFGGAVRGDSSGNPNIQVPSLLRYIPSWETEIRDSNAIYSAYYDLERRLQAVPTYEDLLNDVGLNPECTGLPRMRTFLQNIARSDAGIIGGVMRLRRCRLLSAGFVNAHHDPSFNGSLKSWTDKRIDGILYDVSSYRADVLATFGGLDGVIQHTIFSATGFKSPSGIFWTVKSEYESAIGGRIGMTNAQRMGLSQIPNRRFSMWWSPTINRSSVYMGFETQIDLTGVMMRGKIPTLKIGYVQLFRGHLWQAIHESVVTALYSFFDNCKTIFQCARVTRENVHPRKSYRLLDSCADISLFSTREFKVSQCPELLYANHSHNASDNEWVSEQTLFSGRQASTRVYWIDVQLCWGDYDTQSSVALTAEQRFRRYNGTEDGHPRGLYRSKHGIVLLIDLLYGSSAAFGSVLQAVQDGFSQRLAEHMRLLVDTDPMLNILRERVRSFLQLNSSDPIEESVSSSTVGSLFDAAANRRVFFYDDSSIYRIRAATGKPSSEGVAKNEVLNGFILLMNVFSGRTYMRVIHKSVFTGQSRRSALSKWKSAEELLNLLTVMPKEELPTDIIVLRDVSIDPIRTILRDFPGVSVRSATISIPLANIRHLRILQTNSIWSDLATEHSNGCTPIISTDESIFGFQMNKRVVELISQEQSDTLTGREIIDLVDEGPKSLLSVFDLYEGWVSEKAQDTPISPLICFFRLVLIFRGLGIDKQATHDAIYKSVSMGKSLWPPLPVSDWVNIEKCLRDMICTEYARRTGVPQNLLTRTEVRDIILGQQVVVTDVPQRKEALFSKAVTITNRMGNETTAVVKARSEQFVSEYYNAFCQYFLLLTHAGVSMLSVERQEIVAEFTRVLRFACRKSSANVALIIPEEALMNDGCKGSFFNQQDIATIAVIYGNRMVIDLGADGKAKQRTVIEARGFLILPQTPYHVRSCYEGARNRSETYGVIERDIFLSGTHQLQVCNDIPTVSVLEDIGLQPCGFLLTLNTAVRQVDVIATFFDILAMLVKLFRSIKLATPDSPVEFDAMNNIALSVNGTIAAFSLTDTGLETVSRLLTWITGIAENDATNESDGVASLEATISNTKALSSNSFKPVIIHPDCGWCFAEDESIQERYFTPMQGSICTSQFDDGHAAKSYMDFCDLFE